MKIKYKILYMSKILNISNLHLFFIKDRLKFLCDNIMASRVILLLLGLVTDCLQIYFGLINVKDGEAERSHPWNDHRNIFL